jgi:hypothetical protein
VVASIRRHALIATLLVGGTLAAAGANALASGPTGGSGTTVPSGTTGPTPTPKLIACPAGVASATVTTAQWIWSAYGRPASSATTVTYSQTVGSGTWDRGKAHGTICSQDQGGGEPKRSIVLKVSGPSKLSPGITKGGLLGIGLVYPVTVSATGDAAVCPVGSTGSITLFASYYGVHSDRASMRFAGTCAAWNETFSGSILHVKISNDGAMIRPGSVG